MTLFVQFARTRRCPFFRELTCAALVTFACTTDNWADESTPATKSTEPAVRLVVDYGDGVQKHFTQLKWHDGATVMDVMEAAMRHPRGIRVKYRGKGETLLVLEIDELGNQAARGERRNWIYRINGQLGQRSAGICPVENGDTVLWSFETYR